VIPKLYRTGLADLENGGPIVSPFGLYKSSVVIVSSVPCDDAIDRGLTLDCESGEKFSQFVQRLAGYNVVDGFVVPCMPCSLKATPTRLMVWHNYLRLVFVVSVK